jgi:CubicO group peptidase (beta-lactamase class C family)
MRIYKFSSLLLLLLLLSCVTTPHMKTPGQLKHQYFQDTDTLDAIIDRYVDNGGYPFLYVRLEGVDGSVIYEHGAVNRNLIPEATIDGQTLIRIWSMSKIVTISVAMDLVEDGILDLSEPVTKYIPEFADMEVAVDENGTALTKTDSLQGVCPYETVPVETEMTLLHLVNHEAGFYYATTGNECLDSNLSKHDFILAKTSQELIDRLASMPLIQHPGDTQFYGTNTTVLGLVAERATGKSLDTLVKERLTGPLHIQGMKYNLTESEAMLPRFSGADGTLREAYEGELDIFGPDVPMYKPDNKVFLGGEGMLATADAYADFLRMLCNRGELNGVRFLEESTIDEITAPHTQLDNPWGHNGYNLWVTSDTLLKSGWGDEGLWQGGGYEGTQFWIDPKRKFVGISMTQINNTPESGWDYYNEFRGEIYKQIFRSESKK